MRTTQFTRPEQRSWFTHAISTRLKAGCAALVWIAVLASIQCTSPDTNTDSPGDDACSAATCQNGGTCVDDGEGIHCDCPAAFTGEHCERVACQEPAYYVSPTGAGDVCTSSQPCGLDYAMANPVPRSTVCLMNGDYGEVIFDQKQGEAGALVRFVADPSTTVARDENWYTNDLARPDAGEAVIFSRLAFRTLPASGYFVEVDGINVMGGNVNMAGVVTDIVIRNASVFGDWSEYSSEVTGSAFNIYYWDIPNSNYTNILIENCYSERTAEGVHINGQFDNVVIRNNHFHSFAGSGMTASTDSGTAVFEGNHVHHQISLADTQKTSSTVQSVSADRLFVTLTAAVNTWDTAEFINPAGGKHLASMVNSNQVASVVELREPLPFIPNTGIVTHGHMSGEPCAP